MGGVARGFGHANTSTPSVASLAHTVPSQSAASSRPKGRRIDSSGQTQALVCATHHGRNLRGPSALASSQGEALASSQEEACASSPTFETAMCLDHCVFPGLAWVQLRWAIGSPRGSLGARNGWWRGCGAGRLARGRASSAMEQCRIRRCLLAKSCSDGVLLVCRDPAHRSGVSDSTTQHQRLQKRIGDR